MARIRDIDDVKICQTVVDEFVVVGSIDDDLIL